MCINRFVSCCNSGFGRLDFQSAHFGSLPLPLIAVLYDIYPPKHNQLLVHYMSFYVMSYVDPDDYGLYFFAF